MVSAPPFVTIFAAALKVRLTKYVAGNTANEVLAAHHG